MSTEPKLWEIVEADGDLYDGLIDDVHDKWDTACGEAFKVMSDGPTENAMRFCPFCAHPIPESENDQ